MVKGSRLIYKVSFSENFVNLCSDCYDRYFQEGKYGYCVKIRGGSCRICGYEKKKSKLTRKKSKFKKPTVTESEIKRMKNLIERLEKDEYKIEIEEIRIKRKSESSEQHNRPKDIRIVFEFPIELDYSLIVKIIKENIENIKKKGGLKKE